MHGLVVMTRASGSKGCVFKASKPNYWIDNFLNYFDFLKKSNVVPTNKNEKELGISVTIFSDLFDFGQLLKAFGNN